MPVQVPPSRRGSQRNLFGLQVFPGTLPRVWLLVTPKLNLDVHLAWRAVGLMSRRALPRTVPRQVPPSRRGVQRNPFGLQVFPGTRPRVWLLVTPKLNLDVHLAWRAVELMSR